MQFLFDTNMMIVIQKEFSRRPPNPSRRYRRLIWIGQATAQRLAKAGYQVYGTADAERSRARDVRHAGLDVTRDESVGSSRWELMRLEGRSDCCEQRWLRRRSRRSGRESIEQARAIFVPTSSHHPDDARRGAPQAATRKWPHHQHRFRARFPAHARSGALCRDQTRDRRLFRVSRQ